MREDEVFLSAVADEFLSEPPYRQGSVVGTGQGSSVRVAAEETAVATAGWRPRGRQQRPEGMGRLGGRETASTAGALWALQLIGDLCPSLRSERTAGDNGAWGKRNRHIEAERLR